MGDHDSESPPANSVLEGYEYDKFLGEHGDQSPSPQRVATERATTLPRRTSTTLPSTDLYRPPASVRGSSPPDPQAYEYPLVDSDDCPLPSFTTVNPRTALSRKRSRHRTILPATASDGEERFGEHQRKMFNTSDNSAQDSRYYDPVRDELVGSR